ncbi:hypothetical protein ACEQPO_26615 [Bacillus sp. SL00103]
MLQKTGTADYAQYQIKQVPSQQLHCATKAWHFFKKRNEPAVYQTTTKTNLQNQHYAKNSQDYQL